MYLIFGSNDCFYCKKAKELLDAKGEDYTWIDVREGNNKELLLSIIPGTKTIPQILEISVVGGFSDLQARLHNG